MDVFPRGRSRDELIELYGHEVRSNYKEWSDDQILTETLKRVDKHEREEAREQQVSKRMAEQIQKDIDSVLNNIALGSEEEEDEEEAGPVKRLRAFANSLKIKGNQKELLLKVLNGNESIKNLAVKFEWNNATADFNSLKNKVNEKLEANNFRARIVRHDNQARLDMNEEKK